MRVAPRPLGRYPWYLRLLLRRQRRKYGQILQPALLWARVPRLYLLVAALFTTLDRRRSPLDPVLRSLVAVRAAQLNGCRFCVDLNGALLAERAGSMEKVQALDDWRDNTLFDGRERAVLEYVEAASRSDRQVSNEMVEVLHRFFDEDAIVELTAVIAFQNMSSRFNAALDVAPQGFCTVQAGPDEAIDRQGPAR